MRSMKNRELYPSTPDVQLDAPDWTSEAACANIPTNVFFDADIIKENERQIKRICNNCPVRLECEDYAISNGLDYGIYGGKTAAERQRIIEARQAVENAYSEGE